MNASPTLHPTDQTLQAYRLRELDDGAAESVDNHLESCADCRRRVAELSADRVLERVVEAHGRPEQTGPMMSSTAGLSILAAGAAGSPTPPPASTLPTGLADHPDYEILRELGRGGMGVVYLAQNRLMGRTEVLKVVGVDLINRRGVLDRFLAEIRNVSRLHHPNIVKAHSALRIGESLVLAMEHVEGVDLAKMVQASGPLPAAHACKYAHQAALGLQHAHEHGMVHRDIKPGNLMLAGEGDRAVIKVLDFGLAKVRSEGAVDGGLTHEGQMLGTPAYIAPEQIRDARRADIRADIYSLGCTLYHLLTGGPPFQGVSLYDTLHAHHSMEATPLNLARPEVPVELAALVAKMMAKEPKRRFQEPKEVGQALAQFFDDGNLAFKSPEADVPLSGQSNSGRRVPGIITTPSQPVMNDAEPIAQENVVAKPSATDTEWNSSIDLSETERTQHETPAIAPTRRPPWLWPSVAVGVWLLVALFIAWAALIKVNMAPIPSPAVRVGNKLARAQANDREPSFDGRASILSGSWKVEGKELVQNGGEGTILLGDLSLSSFDIRFKGQIVSGNGGFVTLFHCTSDNNLRYFDVGEAAVKSAGKRADSGFRHDDEEGHKRKDVFVDKGRWYNVMVKVRGVEFWCYLQDQELFHDLDTRFARGRIGFATWDADARYRDIVIATPDGRILWEGPPDLPLEAADERGASASAVELPATASLVKRETESAAATSKLTGKVADKRSTSAIAVEGPDTASVLKRETESAALLLKPAQKMSLPPTRLVHVDEFNGPRVALPRDLNIQDQPTHGRSDGVYFVYSPGGWRYWNVHRIRSDGTCEVIARVLSEDPRKTAAWTASVVSESTSREFHIKVNVKGELFLEPSPWAKARAFRQIDPRIGPIVHPAIKPGNEFNKLMLVMKMREVAIFVNGVQVCAPVKFDYDVTPSVLALGAAGPGKKRAEFDRVEIREVTESEDAPN